MKLTVARGCTRFGMDDGYMVGPIEVVFKVLAEFAKGIREGTGCELVTRKCKIYNMDAGAWQDYTRKDLIPSELSLMEEGIYVNEDGDRLRGVIVFNACVGEPEYVKAVLRNKAQEMV